MFTSTDPENPDLARDPAKGPEQHREHHTSTALNNLKAAWLDPNVARERMLRCQPRIRAGAVRAVSPSCRRPSMIVEGDLWADGHPPLDS